MEDYIEVGFYPEGDTSENSWELKNLTGYLVCPGCGRSAVFYSQRYQSFVCIFCRLLFQQWESPVAKYVFINEAARVEDNCPNFSEPDDPQVLPPTLTLKGKSIQDCQQCLYYDTSSTFDCKMQSIGCVNGQSGHQWFKKKEELCV